MLRITSQYNKLYITQLIAIRSIRTRVAIPIKPIEKSPIKEPSSSSSSSASSINEELVHIPNKSPTNPRLRSSRFASSTQKRQSNNIADNLIQNMKFKDAQTISQELREQFIKDGIDIDDKFIEEMIKESEKEQNIVMNYLENPKNTVNKLKDEEFQMYVEWLINDGFDRINLQQQDLFKKEIELREKLNEFVKDNNNKEDPDSLTNAFIMTQEMSKIQSKSALDNLPIFLKHLSTLNNKELQDKISLDQYSKLYEISTQLLESNNRDLCIYLCGKLLYSSLIKNFGNRARPDPINEKFFIESCIKYNDFDRAINLYSTRVEKDVKDERFWYELGVTIYLNKYTFNTIDNNNNNNNNTKEINNEDLNIAIELIQKIIERWGYINNIQLIEGLKACCSRSNFNDAWWFWEEIEINMNEIGVIKEINIPKSKLYDESERNEVFNYYNRVDKVSFNGIIECIFAFMSRLKFDKAIEIMNKALNYDIDNEFIYQFVKKFTNQFNYSGRELFLFYLEKYLKDNNNKDENKEIYQYLYNEIGLLQKNRCSSIEEAQLLEDINIYLERVSNLKNIDPKKIFKVNDFKEILQSGEKLTSFDVKSLIKIILENKSNTSFQLASKIIYQMNNNKINNINDSIFPIANSYVYTELCNKLLSQSKPRVKEINNFLKLMEQYDIKLDPNLVSKIIKSYVSKKLYSESIKFINDYVFSNNRIAIQINYNSNQEEIIKEDKKLYTDIFTAFYKSVKAGSLTKEIYHERLKSLQFFTEKLLKNDLYIDENTLQEAMTTFLAYGDYQSVICLIQFYGNKLGNEGKLKFKLVLALKTKLEITVAKTAKYITKNDDTSINNEISLNRIAQYRRKFGTLSLSEDIKTQRDYPWQEVATVVYRFAELFGYKATYTKEDPFSLNISDYERQEKQKMFDTKLLELQHLYGLDQWHP